MNELESSRIKIDELEYERDCLKRELQIQRNTSVEGAFAATWRLTKVEAAILAVLYARGGAIVSRDSMMTALYSDRANEPDPKIIDVYRCKLRAKLPKDTIQTVWGQGQRLSDGGMETCRFVIGTLTAQAA